MEFIVANTAANSIRRTTLCGADYIVANATLIVPGVLDGSKGKFYYPVEEVVDSPDKWNGFPIVVYHPYNNGKPVSARQPDIIDKHWVGNVYRASATNKLQAELWFNVDALKRVDTRILNSLESSLPIELSTGLFPQVITHADEDATFNGRAYDYVAGNLVPDHLAVLPDKIGACSIPDGCGVLVNQAKFDTSEYFPMCANVVEYTPVANMELSYQDKDSLIYDAFRKAHPTKYDPTTGYPDYTTYCSITSVFDGYFIYSEGEELYRQSYKIDKNGKVKLVDDSQAVRREIKYVPIDD